MARVARTRFSGLRRSRGRRSLGIVLAAAAFALPAALAFACVPGASIGFSPSPYRYHAGDTIQINGVAFHRNVAYKLTLRSPSGEVTTPIGNAVDGPVATDATGGFTDSYKVPANAQLGTYLVTAETTGPGPCGMGSGTDLQTCIQRESFDVVAKQAVSLPPPAARQTPAPALPAPFAGRTLTGTSGNDKLIGTPFDDVITCGAGNDIAKGGGGNDVIKCGRGKDQVRGGPGDDKISGGTGNDKLYGNAGEDVLRGGKGKDRLFGGAGDDRLYRDRQDVVVRGGGGKNSIVSVK